MSYFSYLPNVYIGEGVADDENFKYRLVKNIFRRVKTREDLDKFVSQFESYSVRPGETPSNLAHRIYGNVNFDWCILLANNIVDVYDQWPKSESELQEYVKGKYSDPDGVHHYETQEVLYNDIVFLKEGIEVNSSFRATLPDGTILSENASIYPVSNYEHETYLNEQLRLISLPSSALVELMVSEFAELVAYEDHAELDELGNKKTPINLASKFISNVGTTQNGSIAVTENIGQVTSFDYGPTAAGVASSTSTSTTTTTTTTTTSTSSSSSSSSGSSGSSGSGGGSGY